LLVDVMFLFDETSASFVVSRVVGIVARRLQLVATVTKSLQIDFNTIDAISYIDLY
jgi:hypothetical protein